MREPDDGTLPNTEAQNDVDYFLGIDLHPPLADEFFGAARDEQLAIGIEIADVPGREPLVIALGRPCGPIAGAIDAARPVLLELNLPGRARSDWSAFRVDESYVN